MSTTTKTPTPVALFGKDHWSTFAFLEHVAVNKDGIIGMDGRERMRCDPDIHPGLTNSANRFSSTKYPTRLKDGSEIKAHDDWSCFEDLEEAGLVEWKGTGINPVVVFTERGLKVAGKIRAHIQRGGNYNDFEPGAMV